MSQGHQPPETTQGFAVPLAAAFLAAASASALVYASTVGRFVRPISDDWCQTGITRRLGVGGMINHYWHENGRLGNALIAAVVATRFPDRQWLPAVLLIGGAAALYFFTVTVADVLTFQVPRSVVAAVCLAMAAACLIRDGNGGEGNLQYQTLFWAPGSITHTLPAIALATLGATALTLRRSRGFVVALPFIFVIAAMIGTVTEIFTALLGALLVMVLAARRLHGSRADRVDAVLATGVAAMVTGAAILLFSPGLHSRTSTSPLSAAALRAGIRVEPTLLQHALVEPWLAVPVVCGLFLGSCATRLGDQRAGSGAAIRWSAAACVMTAVAGSFATAVADASAYSVRQSALGVPRTWGDFMVMTGLTVFVAAACVGYVVKHRSAAKRSLTAAAVLAALVTGGVLYLSAANLHALTPAYRTRAAQWDAENARITREVAEGASTVRYEDLPLAGLAEPFGHTGKPTFAARCLQQYYGVAKVERAGATPPASHVR
jgi:hypothetical protein